MIASSLPAHRRCLPKNSNRKSRSRINLARGRGMLRAIVEFSLRLRGIVIAIACLAVLYGLYATEHARLGVFPEFAPPRVTIQTEAPGLSPEQVETLVTQRIENALIGTAGPQTNCPTPLHALPGAGGEFSPWPPHCPRAPL